MTPTETQAERRLRTLGASYQVTCLYADAADAIDCGREAIACLAAYEGAVMAGPANIELWERAKDALLARCGEGKETR